MLYENKTDTFLFVTEYTLRFRMTVRPSIRKREASKKQNKTKQNKAKKKPRIIEKRKIKLIRKKWQ